MTRLACFLLALLGAIPIALGAFLTSDAAGRWASDETARLLSRELGVRASFKVRFRLIPLRLSIEQLVVPASDGGSPVLKAESASVAPRFFSLLAGKLDLGDIEIDRPEGRVVIRDGKLQNLAYRLPESPKRAKSTTREAPFSSLSLSEGHFDVELDGVRVKAGPVDIDVFAERGPAFEVALRAGGGEITREHPPLSREPNPAAPPVVEEDTLCRLDLRLRYEPQALLLRRLTLLAAADIDPARGSRARCTDEAADAPGLVVARLSQVQLHFGEGVPPLFDGHVMARVPLALANRFVRMNQLAGHVAFNGDLHWDGSRKLPELRGQVTGASIKFGHFSLAEKLEVDLAISDDKILVPRYYMHFSDGDVVLHNGTISPLAPGVPIFVERVDGQEMLFQALMRDLDVTPDTIVAWNLGTTRVTKIEGTLFPLKLDAELFADTRDFEVTNSAFHDPARKHMIGVKAATVRCRIGVRPGAFEIYDARTDFGKSSMLVKLVSIGFGGQIDIEIDKSSRLDFSDISPIANIPLSGRATLDTSMHGEMTNPLLTANLAVEDFTMGGFSFGNIESAKAKFRPLWVEFTDLVAKKGNTTYRAPSARLDFASPGGETVLTDIAIKSDAFDLRDFMSMWRIDLDPRFEDIKGKIGVDASVRYAFGGPSDRCGGGYVMSRGRISVGNLELFQERYDGGSAQYEMRWFDRDATYQGIELDVPSLTLRKGPGIVLGSLSMRRGAVLRGTLNGTDVPLTKIDTLPALFKAADGTVSASAEISGSLDALVLAARAKVSELRLGRATFGPSDLTIKLTPASHESVRVGTTACGGPIFAPFDRAEYDKDRNSGVFQIDGSMLGGQVTLRELTITRQRKKQLQGHVDFDGLDVAAAAEMVPSFALADARPAGRLSAHCDLSRFDMEDVRSAKGECTLSQLGLDYVGYRLAVPAGASPLTLQDGKLQVPNLALQLTTPRAQTVTFDVSGSVTGLGTAPEVSATLGLRPLPLATLLGMSPRVERAEGSVSGKLQLFGSLAAPRYQGGFELERGEVALHGFPTPISEISLSVALGGGEIDIVRGTARIGAGSLQLRGGAPLKGFEIGDARIAITARNLSLPATNGIRAVADADLTAAFRSGSSGVEQRVLPRLSGQVTLKSFEYRRPVTMTADISSLAQRGKRSEFDAYDPSDDAIEFDVNIRSERALRLQNNLIEAELALDDRGLLLSGTNARYGLRGDVSLKPGGRIKLRRSDFEIKEGRVRFDDVTRIAPRVDVTAVTEYRRYSTASSATTTSPSATGASSSGSGAAARGGRFRITLHAHGDADKLKIDLTSDPALAQDDIFLLITIGLTRAELDQAQSASVGESVALEALGTITGADRAVTDAVPLIDELRFGSAYSSRTGRTEPTVTIGKRLADRIRANVTSGVAESREIRSNVEWQLSPKVSVEGSYDNVNDISSSSLGNLGADIRWRMEFE